MGGFDTYFVIYILVLAAVTGAVFGSFINCLAYRMVSGESILEGRSHCTACGHKLNPLDLIPMVSYILLRGRCRYCQQKISPVYPAAEFFTAMVFVLITAKFGLSILTLRYLVLSCILIGLSLVDLRSYIIPNGFIVCGILNWLIFLPFTLDTVKTSLAGAFIYGGGMLALSLIFDRLTGKESLGGGDIKLFFMTGLYLGILAGLYNLILACIIGIIFAFIFKKRRIAFGPAISVATFISILTGQEVVSLYLGLFY